MKKLLFVVTFLDVLLFLLLITPSSVVAQPTLDQILLPQPNTQQNPQPNSTQPAMTSCVVTAENTGDATGQRASVTCTGSECAYKYITNYVQIGSRYGPRRAPCAGCSTFHKGIDLPGPQGTPIKALEPGTVTLVTSNPNAATGYSVEIRDDNNRKHSFFHLITKSSLTVGKRVNAGQEIGKMGATGRVTGVHLHYQISTPNGDYADPDVILKNWPNY